MTAKDDAGSKSAPGEQGPTTRRFEPAFGNIAVTESRHAIGSWNRQRRVACEKGRGMDRHIGILQQGVHPLSISARREHAQEWIGVTNG